MLQRSFQTRSFADLALLETIFVIIWAMFTVHTSRFAPRWLAFWSTFLICGGLRYHVTRVSRIDAIPVHAVVSSLSLGVMLGEKLDLIWSGLPWLRAAIHLMCCRLANSRDISATAILALTDMLPLRALGPSFITLMRVNVSNRTA
jgi:hypothetical protein